MRIDLIELPTITGMKTVNCVLVRSNSCVTLVDAGEASDESYQILTQKLKNFGLTVADIDEVIISHAHVDHIGGAARIAINANCPVRVSNMVSPWTHNLRELWTARAEVITATLRSYMPKSIYESSSQMYTDMMEMMLNIWDEIPQERVEVFDIHDPEILINGEKWKMIYAPGHASTQNCFLHESSQSLISADMILRITPTPVIEVSQNDNYQRAKSILSMLESYELFKEVPMNLVYPGHYGVIENAHILLDEQVARIHQRKEETMQVIQSGKNSLLDIYAVVYKGRFHLPAFNMMLGYIDLLESEGRLQFYDNGEFLNILPA